MLYVGINKKIQTFNFPFLFGFAIYSYIYIVQQMALKWALIFCHRKIRPPAVIDHLTVGLADLKTVAQ